MLTSWQLSCATGAGGCQACSGTLWVGSGTNLLVASSPSQASASCWLQPRPWRVRSFSRGPRQSEFHRAAIPLPSMESECCCQPCCCSRAALPSRAAVPPCCLPQQPAGGPDMAQSSHQSTGDCQSSCTGRETPAPASCFVWEDSTAWMQELRFCSSFDFFFSSLRFSFLPLFFFFPSPLGLFFPFPFFFPFPLR